MAQSGKLYTAALNEGASLGLTIPNALNSITDVGFGSGVGRVNATSHTWNLALLATSDISNVGTHVHYSDVTSKEVAAGNGYSTGGQALSAVTLEIALAETWPVQWAPSTAYNLQDVVSVGNGYLYQCTTAGTSGGAAPTAGWLSAGVGQTVTDGTATWTNAGPSLTVLSSAPVSWTVPASDTLSAAGAVIYDTSGGSASSDLLVAAIDFGGTVSVTGAASYPVGPADVGWVAAFPN